MQVNMDWQITVGDYKLAMLAAVEIHKSVDVLAATCRITLPGSAYNNAFRVENLIKRGDPVTVKLGYDAKLQAEFEGYLLNIGTDRGSLTLNCEDDLFLLRIAVHDKQFVNAQVKDIAQYLLNDAGVKLKLNCTLTIDYDKFVISKATAYDVLKKLKDETKANIFLKDGALHIHPPYTQQFDLVRYSFQQNIEKDDLKYVRAADRKIQVVVSATGKDGKKREVKYGTTGGDRIEVNGDGMSDAAMRQRAKTEYDLNFYDGYEGSITTWLIPSVQPGDSAEIKDQDYEYKDGRYFVTAVTTNFDSNGAARKVQLGKKLA